MYLYDYFIAIDRLAWLYAISILEIEMEIADRLDRVLIYQYVPAINSADFTATDTR